MSNLWHIIKWILDHRRQILWAYLLFLAVYWWHTVNSDHRRPAHAEAYIQAFGPVASDLSRETGVPVAIILAAGGLESGWGRSELARESNNHFGIKNWEAGQPSHCLITQEFTGRQGRHEMACFRAYDSPQDSFRDYCRKLMTNPRYKPLFQYSSADYENWARGLQSCGYATDPDYARKLIRVIETYELDAGFF